jgi:hypothetical protein
MEASGWFGPYQLLRPLDPARVGPADSTYPQARRWAALHERDHTGHLIYSLGTARDRFAKKRFLAAAEKLAPVRHAHLLTIESYALSDKLGACLVAPYSGHQGGVVTLGELIEHKGGRLPAAEAQRALTHLLEGVSALHDAGVADGALGLDRIHVDPRGSLLIELPGFWRAQRSLPQLTDIDRRADICAVATMGHQMLTGAASPEGPPSLPADIDPRWRAWLTIGLDPLEGFATASDALRSLPAASFAAPTEPKPGLVRSLLGKIKSVMPLL